MDEGREGGLRWEIVKVLVARELKPVRAVYVPARHPLSVGYSDRWAERVEKASGIEFVAPIISCCYKNIIFYSLLSIFTTYGRTYNLKALPQ